MLPIYLCDDNAVWLEHLKKIIANYIWIEDLDMKLVCTATSSEELLKNMISQTAPALYFLDIELNSPMDGFDLAEKIRQKDPRGFIVFITTHSEFSHLTFERQVEAMDYILKDNFSQIPERILSCLKKSLSLYRTPANKIHPTLTFKSDSKYISVPFDEIYYITTCQSPHKLRIYSKNGIYEFWGALQEVVSLLNDSFFLCHKSCIVNTNHIKEINRYSLTVTLTNGLTCPVSSRTYHSLEKKYIITKSYTN